VRSCNKVERRICAEEGKIYLLSREKREEIVHQRTIEERVF